jgi:hypothetical protein
MLTPSNVEAANCGAIPPLLHSSSVYGSPYRAVATFRSAVGARSGLVRRQDGADQRHTGMGHGRRRRVASKPLGHAHARVTRHDKMEEKLPQFRKTTDKET